MELTETKRKMIFDAASQALRFNAPLSDERATTLVEQFSAVVQGPVTDLGCGIGSLTRAVAASLRTSKVRGIDTNPTLIEIASSSATADSSATRAVFEVGDASSWTGPDGGAICVGASHAFGGPAEMIQKITDGVPQGGALIGDAYWQVEPDDWCLETFGEMPRRIEFFERNAKQLGWNVVECATSSMGEWDAFERVWSEGARSEGSAEAIAFASKRALEYQRYRGVLGFCWLVLRR